MKQLEKIYQTRRVKILKQIPNGVALFCAAKEQTSDRDQNFPFQQEADFFYLTGINEPNAAILLINTKKYGMKSLLFIKDKAPAQERWTGQILGIAKAKKILKFNDVLDIQNIIDGLRKYLVGASTLHYALGNNDSFDNIVFTLLKSTTAPRVNYPNTLSDSRLLTAKMRWIKNQYEISCLKQAAKITTQGLRNTITQLKTFSSERDCATALEREYFKLGAENLAFPTIVAGGKNATTLHHMPTNKPLPKKELVLIDTGAKFSGYCGDVTRTVPVSGVFTKEQKAVYNIVLRALEVGIKNAKPKKTLTEIHYAICISLTEGLLELGVLKKGKVAKLVKDGAYKFFYMHRSGHPLGLNTHDIEPLYELNNNNFKQVYDMPLVAGNVFTIEPGLYFDLNDKTVPKKYRGIGIRIEEDILITRTACEVLSKGIPRNAEEIEKLYLR
ncbi:MAG: aminopeptidase P N-terminal domain-containing protein [Deltaproteobacteria bacterium]|jgi:Xaa-Pro aminopeptidase|nr:aminopeptidase P N-terminal domain-containing protein [Deltaproteobacteria bacterium]